MSISELNAVCPRLSQEQIIKVLQAANDVASQQIKKFEVYRSGKALVVHRVVYDKKETIR